MAATINQDNTSTINLAHNGMSNSEKTRHISIRYFFVTDRIKSGEIYLQHLGTAHMIADILTKPLQGELFVQFGCSIERSTLRLYMPMRGVC